MRPASYIGGMYPLIGEPAYPELWRGCVGAWAPCLGPTGVTLRDWSGRVNNGTLTNGASFSINGPQYAIRFDGTDDFIRVPRFTDYNTLLSTQKTVSVWFRASSPGSSYRTLWSQDRCFSVTVKDGVFTTYDWAAASDRTSGINVADNIWHHLAITINPGVSNGSEFFVDGRKVGSSFTYSAQFGSSGMDMSFGTALTTLPLNTPAAEYINAWADDFRLYYGLVSPNLLRLLASRRGIAYDVAPRKRTRTFAGFKAYWAARKALIQMAGST